MKHLVTCLYGSRLGKILKRLAWVCTHQPQTTVHGEMLQGAVIGLVACGGLATFLSSGGLPLVAIAGFSSLGMFFGGVIGVLLWIGSARLPEDPIPAPSPRDLRSKGARQN